MRALPGPSPCRPVAAKLEAQYLGNPAFCSPPRPRASCHVRYVRKYLVRGRERFEYSEVRRQDIVGELVVKAMGEMDLDNDGKVSMDDFVTWSRTQDIENLVDNYMDEFNQAKAEQSA